MKQGRSFTLGSDIRVLPEEAAGPWDRIFRWWDRLKGRRFRDVGFREKLCTLPFTVLEKQLPEPEDVFCRHTESGSTKGHAFLALVPHRFSVPSGSKSRGFI